MLNSVQEPAPCKMVPTVETSRRRHLTVNNIKCPAISRDAGKRGGNCMASILDKEPKLVWKHFDEIRKIPRCSKHEEKIRKYFIEFAKSKKLEWAEDKAGNVVIRAPATKGLEKRPVVVLQCHMDMVCEKNSDKKHDFSKDPLELVLDGDWLKANGTTLGADNGVGCAMALAALEDKELKHGPLEALFTVDEETGLTGAFSMEPDLVKGRLMVNLDSEEVGSVFIGCSGGGDSTLTLPVTAGPVPKGYEPLDLKVSGLKGGHSGVDIHEQRANAIKVLVRVLNAGWAAGEFLLADIKGGNLRNAIPREAFAVIAVKADKKKGTSEKFKAMAAAILDECRNIDPGLVLDIKDSEAKEGNVLDAAQSRKLLDLLLGLPHGVQAMSLDMPGLVETSCNLAVIGFEGKLVKVQTSSRSSIKSALAATREKIRSIATLAGAKVDESAGYPGWKPNLKSKLLAITKDACKEITGKDPALKAIHAGLETGIVGERFPGMDMVSIGPDLNNPHSPDERVGIASVAELYRILGAVLRKV